MDLYTLFHSQNPFRKSFFEIFFEYTAYALVKSASDSTTGVEPAIEKANFYLWILFSAYLNKLEPRLTGAQMNYQIDLLKQ
jgi:hypothetical protein